MEKIPVVTIEDRIEVTGDFKEYFDAFIPFEERIRRFVWQKINHKGRINKNDLTKLVMKEFGVSKRTANSVIIEMTGRYNSLKELTREQLKNKKRKTNKIKQKIKTDKAKLKQLDKRAAKRPLTKKEQKELRQVKSRLYQRENRLNRLKQQIEQMEMSLESGKFKLCFGSRRLFKAQHYLEENGFRTHNQWLKVFRTYRDKNAFYLGSREETGTNSQFQVSYNSDTDSFSFKIRKEYAFMKNEQDKYLYLEGIHFNHLRDYFRKVALEAQKGLGEIPLTYRIKKRGRKYYLQAIFRLPQIEPVPTVKSKSALGIDFNSGFLALSEINEDGNLVGVEQLKITGVSSGERKDSLLKAIKKLSKEAKEKGITIVAEDLKFNSTKAKMVRATSKRGKNYNRMLSSLEYKRFKDALISRCYKDGVKLIFVDPRNTTKIGKQKYARKRSINAHNSAAYIIARRGMKFKEKLA